VVVINPTNNAFEYIGEPILLSKDQEIANLSLLIKSMKEWLKRPENERLSTSLIFTNYDKTQRGEISSGQMVTALGRLGIKLRESEV